MTDKDALQTFETLFVKAEYCREKGNPAGAIHLFNAAIKLAITRAQVLEANLQIGLCFEHMEEYGRAESVYETVLKKARQEGILSVKMNALRHLLSIMVHDKNTLEAIRTGHEAIAIMHSLPELPPNAVWVTHGLCKALKANRSPRDIVAKYAAQEREQLKYAREIGVPSLHYDVWFTGWLSDMAYAHVALSWWYLSKAFWVSVVKHLPLRLKQFRSGIR